jgi:tripartite-type tricarboxylate transporter receptor subunit TctC
MNGQAVQRRDKETTMKFLARFAVSVMVAGSASGAYAQAYPNKPVTIVVPYAPGGATDIVVRMMGQILSTQLGQSFVIENKPGGGGLIGIEQVARSKPDGYTLLGASTGPVTISPLLYKDRKFDPMARLEPISLFANTPGILMVRNGVAAKSVDELVALSRSQPPGKLNMASSGNGSLQQLMGEFFQIKNGIKWTHIPFTGSVPAMNELMAERVDTMVDVVASAAPFVQAGRLRALAVTTPKRSSRLPDVPTMAELGYPGYNFSGWQALLAPKGTPPEIVEKLNAVLDKALKTPEVKDQLDKLGAEPIGGAPSVLGNQMGDEIREWSEIIQSAGVVVGG